MNLLHFSFNLNTVPYSFSVISFIVQPACSLLARNFSHSSLTLMSSLQLVQLEGLRLDLVDSFQALIFPKTIRKAADVCGI